MTNENNKTASIEFYLIANLENNDDHCDEILSLSKIIKVSAVLLSKIKGQSKEALNERIKKLQAHNIAVLLEDDYELVLKTGADGVHITSDDVDNFKTAQQRLGEDYIIGVKAHESRHQTMLLGEQGASYMAIDIKAKSENNSSEQSENDSPPTLEWWSSLFATPSIAWNLNSGQDLINACLEGADFLGVSLANWHNDAPIKDQLQTLIPELNELKPNPNS